MLRIICIFLFLSLVCNAFPESKIHTPATDVWEMVKLHSQKAPFSDYLIEQWKDSKNRKELHRKYIVFFEDVVSQIFSVKGIAPGNYCLTLLAPFYIYWVQETKNQDFLSYVLALSLDGQMEEAENVLKKMLEKEPDNEKYKLLAGAIFPKKMNSPFLEKYWNQIEQNPTEKIITVVFFLWSRIPPKISSFKTKVFSLVEKHKEMIPKLTFKQKESFLKDYLLTAICNRKTQAENEISLERKKTSLLYRTIAPSLNGVIIKIHCFETCMLITSKKNKNLDTPLQVILIYPQSNRKKGDEEK